MIDHPLADDMMSEFVGASVATSTNEAVAGAAATAAISHPAAPPQDPHIVVEQRGRWTTMTTVGVRPFPPAPPAGGGDASAAAASTFFPPLPVQIPTRPGPSRVGGPAGRHLPSSRQQRQRALADIRNFLVTDSQRSLSLSERFGSSATSGADRRFDIEILVVE